MNPDSNLTTIWPLWKKLMFRFFFIYFAFLIAPWTWLDAIPGVSFVTQYYYQMLDWAVNTANAKIFHIRPELVPLNGSGDTSYGYAQMDLMLVLSFLGCIVWSIADRQRPNYKKLNYWLCLFVRYYVALVAFSYGIIKLFSLQMPFPSLSQLNTPLGDYLPMRLSWMFLGYSSPYQIFSGAMEVLAGTLLLYRRTTTLGVLLATAVFMNVMVLNLSYDIPVKLYSIHIVALCLYLLVNESQRIICFFILNKPAQICSTYHFPFTKKWMRVSRVVLKTLFIIVAVGMVFYHSIEWKNNVDQVNDPRPFRKGVYEVAMFVVNNDTIPQDYSDTLRWQDFIIDTKQNGSIKTADTAFRQRYRRGYFSYSADSALQTVTFKNGEAEFASFKYQMPDTNTILLTGNKRGDSLYVVLKKTPRHFQLAEKQFHWLSEYNR